jgi:hypothetical protein
MGHSSEPHHKWIIFQVGTQIKALLETNLVIHDAIKKTAKVLESKQQFYEDRKKFKAHLAEWNAELDLDDIRECNMAPEVAHIAQDSLSEEADSFYSSSVTSIIAFEVREIYIPMASQQKCLVYPMTPSNRISKILNQRLSSQMMKY